MAGNLEKQFEVWTTSQDNPEEYIWLQSTKSTVELLFMGFEIHISFPIDIADLKSFLTSFTGINASNKVTIDVDQDDDGQEEDEDDSDNEDEDEDQMDEDGDFGDDMEEDEEDAFENDEFQEALQTLKMKKVWAKKEQEIRAQLGEKKKKDPKVSNIFSSDAAFGILTNDLFSIMQNVHSLGFSAQPIDDNIYWWQVKIFGFDQSSKIHQQLQQVKKEFEYDYVELQVLFTEDLYPFYPPTLKIIRPRLQGFMIGKIAHLEILTLENWNPICDMRFVLNHLKEVLEKYAQLDVNNPLNSLQNSGSYSLIEHYLLRLELLSNIVPRANLKYGLPSSIVKPANVITKQKADQPKDAKGQYWAKGTGYGRGGTQGWNVEAFVAAQKERDSETISLINAIEMEVKKNQPNFDVLEESCLIPFFESYCRDIAPLDVERHSDLFISIFTLIETLVDYESFVPLFSQLSYQTKSLGEFLAIAGTQIEIVFKVLDETQRKALKAQSLMLVVNKKVQTKLKSMMDELRKLESARAVQLRIPGEVDTAVDTKYCNLLKSHMFEMANLGAKTSSSNSQSRILRIAQEQGGLVHSLPLTFDSSVFVRVDENHMDTMEALITGPADTPYSAGCFLFHITFPANYPAAPPHVTLLTTGGGTVRFNPNLYNSGKVCLSLLGTWSGGEGENWNPNTSTLLQVLVSIQSLILVPEPFFNEPGYETQMGSAQGRASSLNYNSTIRIAAIEWAMVDMIKKPPAYFKDIIHAHFYYQRQKIKQQCDKWLEDCKSNSDAQFKMAKTINNLNAELANLKEPKPF
ncbi:Ubiquitin-conjugating BIR-domain enzyme [Cavenderia fasciculata]|uniref:Ubiquitin-conjugating BIR-domain enzyme n=1 Tax=Cavenderia fasciculata TaxID=261658 RepID=F4PU03_CACFS|nr:Ubiquitin-conjugating BIR-domain enzyme [Cavenderia fasciculata]EGG21771.1 Ubiquitin-conjugating BIR-domain enzyme [Cavenderia fasciculata]|eukprot:XP_004359621.1 Ubiquitin-conjugating BIR-domain enzyme [Cavenderia fasciculata]